MCFLVLHMIRALLESNPAHWTHTTRPGFIKIRGRLTDRQRKGSAPSSALHPPNPQIFTDWLTLRLWITDSLNLSAAGHYK
jgi:hypothetical protein